LFVEAAFVEAAYMRVPPSNFILMCGCCVLRTRICGLIRYIGAMRFAIGTSFIA